MAKNNTPAQKAYDICTDYRNRGYDLEFISGKWFRTKGNQPEWGEEIKNIKKEWLTEYPHLFSDINDLEKTLEVYEVVYGRPDDWYCSKIVKAAREIIADGSVPLRPLPFPLTMQQLMIINRLIAGEDEKMFIVTGCGGSGKSTFLNIIRQIFDNDVSACPLSDLTGFNLSEALGRRLIASDELSADDLDNKVLKMIISKQNMQLNPKFGKPYQVKCQSGLFYCCNIPPRIDLSDTGLLRRIVYYEMDKPIQNPDKNLNKKKWHPVDLVEIARHAMLLDMTDWEKDFQRPTRYYLLKNNSVYILRDRDTYGDYTYVCNRKGLKAYSEPRWQEIRDLMKEWGMLGEAGNYYKQLDANEEIPF